LHRISDQQLADAELGAYLPHVALSPPTNLIRLCGLLVGPTHHDPERIIRQWPLQRLRFIPRRAHPDTSRSSSVVRISGMAFGWIGATIAFVSVRLPLERSALI
jgi:hypothetical protein